ncbi:hypothetical protein ACWGIR_23005 [Streptomyces albidoflavus]
MITTTYTLSPAADGLYTVTNQDGAAMSHPLPLETAADMLRRFENGRHEGDPDWRVLTKVDMPALLAALGFTAGETVEVELSPRMSQTFDVESIDVSEIRKGDQILWERAEKPYFIPAHKSAFRLYWIDPSGAVQYGKYTFLLGGTQLSVEPGTTFRRAVNPDAVRVAKNTALRNTLDRCGRR